MKFHCGLVFLLICEQTLAESQFFVSKDDGSYKYAYDNGGVGAEQTSDAFNQVVGRYFYKNALGEDVEVKYTAGVEGFVPLEGEQSDDSDAEVIESASEEPVEDVTTETESPNLDNTKENPEMTKIEQTHGNFNPDGSYAFFYATKDSTRQEFADSNNNVFGKYSYKNGETIHDLSYSAGAKTGFVVTGGSLAQPNNQSPESVIFYQPRNHDGSYSFEFSTPTQSRHEIADSKGNVYGGYSFVNEEGNHDLRYVAGSETGFLPVGGSLLKFKSKGKSGARETVPEGEDGEDKAKVEQQSLPKNSNMPLPVLMKEQLLFLLNNYNNGARGFFYMF